MNKEKKQLILLFLLASILRCLFISTRNIQYDDAFSILLSRQGFLDIISGTAADTMPPLFYFLLHMWSYFFDGIWWLRVLSVLCSLGGLILLATMVNDILGQKAAIWAFFFAAISPFQIYHAQDIRMYALLQLFQMLYLYSFYRIGLQSKKEPSTGIWVLFIASGAFSLYTHNLAAFFLILPNIFLLFTKKWVLMKQVILAQGIIAMLFIPWLFFIPGQIEKIQTAFWTPRPALVEIIQAIAMMTTSLTLMGLYLYIGVALSVILFLIALFLLAKTSLGGKSAKLFFILFTFGLPLILFLVSYVMRPVFVPRAFLTSSLLYFGLLGGFISMDLPKVIKISIIACVTIVSFASLPDFYQFDSFPRSPFREAAAYIHQNPNSAEVVIHDNKLSFFPMAIYDTDQNEVFLADSEDSHNDTLALETQEALGVYPEKSLAEAVSGSERIAFIVFRDAIDEYKDLGYASHPNIDWLNEQFLLISEVAFNDLLIYSYGR